MLRSAFLSAVGMYVGLAVAQASDLTGTDPLTGQTPPAVVGVTQTEPPTCGNHGTAIEFVGSPKEAARQAKKEEKLVFVLHVSGHFEDPRFT